MRFSLSFKTIPCHRCEADRQMGLQCPDCGAQPSPTEVDIHVQRRRRAAEAAMLARRSPVDTPKSSLYNAPTSVSNLGEIITHIGELVERIEKAASLIADEADEGPATLESVAQDITELELWVKKAPEYRPLVTLASLFKKSSTQIVRLFDTLVKALVARDIATAQNLEKQIQKSLDEAALTIEPVTSLLNRIERIAGSTNPMSAWLDEAVEGDIFSALERGKVILEEHDINANGSEAPLLTVVLETIIGAISDSDKFWSAVHQHVSILDVYKSDLLDLVQSEPFASRNDAVMHDILHMARRAISMLPPETVREEITELLDEGYQLIEQPLKLYLGLACTVAGRMSLDESQGAYISGLIKAAEAEGWHHILELIPFSTDLRNAFAHRDYEVTDDGMVRLSPARCASQDRIASVLSYEEVCDAVIALMEACGMMQLALSVVLGDDIEWITIKHSPFLISTIIEGLFGWTNVDLDVSSQKVIVSAVCQDHVKAANIVSIAVFFKDHPGDLILKLSSKKSGEQIFGIALPKLASWNETQDEFDKLIAFLDLYYHMTHNNEPIITPDYIRRFIAISILSLFDDEADSRGKSTSPRRANQPQMKMLPPSPKQFADILNVLKLWRKLADRFKIPDLAEAIQDAIRWRSSLQAGLPISDNLLDPLFGFIDLKVDPVNTFINILADGPNDKR